MSDASHENPGAGEAGDAAAQTPGEPGPRGRTWVGLGERVGLVAPEREEYVSRWDAFNDPAAAMAHGRPTTAPLPELPTLPPYSRRQQEHAYDFAIGGHHQFTFDVCTLADQRCVGEVGCRGVHWPAATGALVAHVYRR